MPTLDQGWAALLGAIVGGAATLGGTLLTGLVSSRAAQKQQNDLIAATALLMQDDFLHCQATLARALDSDCWWDPSRLLPAQSTVDDRKLVWAKLPTKATNVVAGAQGWMDVLIQQRQAVGTVAPLTPHDIDRLRDVFCDLEHGREALQTLARRPFSSFERSGVLQDLTRCTTMQQLIGRPSCF